MAAEDERLLAQPEAICRDQEFRQPRDLKEQRIPAPEPLTRIGADISLQDYRVRHIENGKTNHAIRMLDGHAPRDHRSPIVPDQIHAIFADLVENGDHVRSELRHFVSRNSARLAADVVAALIGSNHTKACIGERTYLILPAVPELGKTMEQDDYRAVLRASSHGVQPNVTIGEPQFFKAWFVGGHSR
jgi:hypothetical protein